MNKYNSIIQLLETGKNEEKILLFIYAIQEIIKNENLELKKYSNIILGNILIRLNIYNSINPFEIKKITKQLLEDYEVNQTYINELFSIKLLEQAKDHIRGLLYNAIIKTKKSR